MAFLDRLPAAAHLGAPISTTPLDIFIVLQQLERNDGTIPKMTFGLDAQDFTVFSCVGEFKKLRLCIITATVAHGLKYKETVFQNRIPLAVHT